MFLHNKLAITYVSLHALSLNLDLPSRSSKVNLELIAFRKYKKPRDLFIFPLLTLL